MNGEREEERMSFAVFRSKESTDFLKKFLLLITSFKKLGFIHDQF